MMLQSMTTKLSCFFDSCVQNVFDGEDVEVGEVLMSLLLSPKGINDSEPIKTD